VADVAFVGGPKIDSEMLSNRIFVLNTLLGLRLGTLLQQKITSTNLPMREDS
jgi:hypothetical protein